jgi:diguanylate cyclase (GGDEF)-like protein
VVDASNRNGFARNRRVRMTIARIARTADDHRTSALVATALTLAGMLAAVVGALSIAHSDSTKARLAFKLASSEIASNLELAIRQEESLVIAASAYVAANPRTTPAQFARWVASVRALERYPELQDIGLIVPVPASHFAAFRAKMLAQPVLPTSRQPVEGRGGFNVIPQGNRPLYCFATAGVVRQQVAVLPPGLDYCATEPSLLAARDTGESSYLPFPEGSIEMLAIQTPIYATGVPPSDPIGRRAAFVGWLGELVVPGVVIGAALQGHPQVAVRFGYHADGSNATFSAGSPRAGAQTTVVDLHNGWTVQTLAVLAGSGLLTDEHALLLLIGGGALSLLVGVLVLVLATGRSRALGLVREQTSELAYQATHDSLTELPNRDLVITRAEEMLARGSVAAALFIDVDGFKNVNDTLGHAAGDRLLAIVARRLLGSVREGDVVGRIGGDEFVVLLDSSGPDAGDVVAERLIGALREPVQLDGSQTVFVSASVGVATGARSTVDELLRDADVALYAAKAAGKDRYQLFESAPVAREGVEQSRSRAGEGIGDPRAALAGAGRNAPRG